MSDIDPDLDPDLDPDAERRIRAGLRAQVAEIDPAIDDSWSEIRRRASTRSNTSRSSFLVAAAAVAALVVVLVTVLAVRRSSSDVATIPAPTTTVATTSTLVAVDAAGHLVELRADGTVVRDIAAGPFLGRVSVSPIDRTIYVERYLASDTCLAEFAPENEIASEIVAVPWAGGVPVVVVRRGSQPAISPDGRRLAYLAGPDDDCHLSPATTALHLTDLADGKTSDGKTSDGKTSELRAVREVVTGIGPPLWTAADELIGVFTRDHSCPFGAPQSACGTTVLQEYELGAGAGGADGTVPNSPDAVLPGPPGAIGDTADLPAVESLAGAADGSIVTAGLADEGRTIVIGRLPFGGTFGSEVETARVDLSALGVAAIDHVIVSVDPGSEQLALSAHARDGTRVVLVGPATDLRPISRSFAGAAWAPGT